VTDQWLSPGTSVSSTKKTDRHDIAESLLKVALSIIATLILYMMLLLRYVSRIPFIRYVSGIPFIRYVSGIPFMRYVSGIPFIRYAQNRKIGSKII
jgi:hypothetical protein